MKLYHYLKANHAHAALQDERLKVAIMNQLNDPFEFRSVTFADKRMQATVERTIEIMAQTEGLICFSEVHTNPVQWAHYAENHTGVCLAFEIDESLLLKIDYDEIRLSHNELKTDGQLPDEIKWRLIKTKFKDWSYEQERRILPTLQNPIDGIHYEQFSEFGELKEIILGIRFQKNRHNVSLSSIAESNAVKSRQPKILKAIACEAEFKIYTEPVGPYNSGQSLRD